MAELELCPLFQDHCVLQCDQSNRLWGKSAPNAQISLTSGSIKATGTANADGAWVLEMDPLPAGGPYELSIKDDQDNEIILEQVYSGEVWICSGQSNMEWTLAQLPSLVHLREAPTPEIRYFRQSGDYTVEPQTQTAGKWRSTDGRPGGDCSAVGMAFAKALQEKINRPIGLIVNAVGGTFIESWIPREKVLATKGGQARKERATTRQQEVLKHLDERKQTVSDWVDEAKADTTDAPVWRRPPLDPLNPGWIAGNQIGACYNLYVHPLKNLSCAGVIWYQGESNADLPEYYYDLYELMVNTWRAHLGNPDLPFYSVQLASWQGEEEEQQGLAGKPRDDGFPGVRQAQADTQRIAHTGMVSAIDVGHKYDIHPIDKDVVGERLAKLALNRLYGHSCQDTGPALQSAKKDGNALLVTFDQGVQASGPVSGFFIRGEGQEWQACPAASQGDNVAVTIPEGYAATELSYAECGYQEVALHNAEGLPALPGRLAVEG